MKVKEERLKMGLQQKEIAELLEISEPNYSKKENGIIKFSVEEAKKMAAFFEKKIEELF